jgi:hypothetical protein
MAERIADSATADERRVEQEAGKTGRIWGHDY